MKNRGDDPFYYATVAFGALVIALWITTGVLKILISIFKC
jgi:hypothetical protein